MPEDEVAKQREKDKQAALAAAKEKADKVRADALARDEQKKLDNANRRAEKARDKIRRDNTSSGKKKKHHLDSDFGPAHALDDIGPLEHTPGHTGPGRGKPPGGRGR